MAADALDSRTEFFQEVRVYCGKATEYHSIR